jgi:hypothetical protein
LELQQFGFDSPAFRIVTAYRIAIVLLSEDWAERHDWQ